MTRLLFSAAFAALSLLPTAKAQAELLPASYVVVANRNAGSVSFIETQSGNLLFTKPLKANVKTEPMYVVSLPERGLIAVGDRLNSQIVFLDNKSAEQIGSVKTARGIFHMYADPTQSKLYVAADVDNVVDIVDLTTFTHAAKFKIPDAYTKLGGKAHDVAVDENYAYITVTGIKSGKAESDRILKVDTKTLAVEGVLKTAFDAHVAVSANGSSNYLVVAVQKEGSVKLIDIATFSPLVEQPYPNAHGLQFFGGETNQYIFSTDIADGGKMGLTLYHFDDINAEFGHGKINFYSRSVDTPLGTPHNVVADFNSKLLFVTHSGESDSVSIYKFGEYEVSFLKTISTGANPFGLTVVNR